MQERLHITKLLHNLIENLPPTPPPVSRKDAIDLPVISFHSKGAIGLWEKRLIHEFINFSTVGSSLKLPSSIVEGVGIAANVNEI